MNDQNTRSSSHLTILGGGPAGLAAGFYAKKRSIPFTLYEANAVIGGNSITLKHGEFLFDSGAHRFHSHDEDITRDVIDLMGPELQEIRIPSQIYFRGKMIDFPLSPLDLLMKLGIVTCVRGAFELLWSKRRPVMEDPSFEEHAVRQYGRTIAEYFLLGYSKKLWGIDCSRISPDISGKRIKGLDLKTFFKEALLGKRSKTRHLDGTFYYPKLGIGRIPERLAESCGEENIHRSSRIIRIFHSDNKVLAIEINGKSRIPVEQVISTLPLPIFLQMMDPAPPADILELARDLRFRNLLLVVLFLNKESLSPNGSLYFPDPELPFTRAYEPRNRSSLMAPPGKTSLVLEIPCQKGDPLWEMDSNELITLVLSKLAPLGWFRASDLIDTATYRISNAYPVLEMGFENKVRTINDFLGNYKNLKISGRSGKFMYTHLHDMMRFGKDMIPGNPSADGQDFFV